MSSQAEKRGFGDSISKKSMNHAFKALLDRSILHENNHRLWTMGLLSSLFGIVFFILDYIRWKEGLLFSNGIYNTLLISHIGAFSCSIATIILFRNNSSLNMLETRNLRWIQITYLSVFILPYMLMSLLSIASRGSVVLFYLLLISLNFIFVTPQKVRIVLNLICYIFHLLTIYYFFNTQPSQMMAKIAESTGMMALTFFMGSINYRQTISNFTNELRFHEHMEAIEFEKNQNQKLMLNLLPKNAVIELRKNGFIQARKFENVTVCILEFVNFDALNKRMSAVRLLRTLNRHYAEFGKILETNGLVQIRGQAHQYIFTHGIPENRESSVSAALNASMEIFRYLKKAERQSSHPDNCLRARIGLHSGTVAAGIIGDGRFSYEIWGDTVTEVEKVKALAGEGEIMLSESTRNLLLNCRVCTPAGYITGQNEVQIQVFQFPV